MKYTTDGHPFNDHFSTTNWHQKGETSLDFNQATDDEVAVASVEPYANHLHLGADR